MTISANLWPAYEDLFDEAEEHALNMLNGKWLELCDNEDMEFQKVTTCCCYVFSELQFDILLGWDYTCNNGKFSQ